MNKVNHFSILQIFYTLPNYYYYAQQTDVRPTASICKLYSKNLKFTNMIELHQLVWILYKKKDIYKVFYVMYQKINLGGEINFQVFLYHNFSFFLLISILLSSSGNCFE